MKTVKDVSEITGISIRTLRYYDEIGLLKPTQLTEAGYRLYDDKALEKLQKIMFFREVEIPLVDIKAIMENSNYDKEQALLSQKLLLEHKRNRLNGIIELLSDAMKGVNTMDFEAFNDADIKKMVNHSLEIMEKDAVEAVINKFGSLEAYQAFAAGNLKDEKVNAHFLKMYGSKDKAVESILQATGDEEEAGEFKDTIDEIYKQFARAKEIGETALAMEAVENLAESYKTMFRLDNARYLLLKVAKDYLHNSVLTEATEKQYGNGITEYIGEAIQHYYGCEL